MIYCRNNCVEIAPYLGRLQQASARHQAAADELNKKLLERARRSKNIPKHVSHLTANQIDSSDRVLTHGEVSKRIYTTLCNEIKFNLYGQQIYADKLTRREKKLIDSLSRPTIASSSVGDSISIEYNLKENAKLIGYDEIYRGPVGLKQNNLLVLKSQGNDGLFAYKGQWEKGCMEGEGCINSKMGRHIEGASGVTIRMGEARHCIRVVVVM